MWTLPLYQIALSAGLLVYLPLILFRKWKKGQPCATLWRRFGSNKDLPSLPKGKHPVIWLHAVSVGETRAIVPLAKALLELPCKPSLVISSITDTGHAEAKRLLPEAACHLYLPLDLSFCVSRVLSKIRPDLVLLSEGDYWLNFLSKARAQGAHLVVVNGKLSHSSSKWYARLPCFKQALFSLFSLFCLQNDLYKTRFLNLGIPSTQLKVLGNMKFETPPLSLSPSQKTALYKQFDLTANHPILVMGSTHDTEETLMLTLCKEVRKQLPNCQFVLAPRHPERCHAVGVEIEANGFICAHYSQLSKTDQVENNAHQSRILLIDQVGLLRDIYALADLAIVCGSFVKHVGGHNILEPALYGVPVLFGPHMRSQEELTDCVLKAKSGQQVTINELNDTVLRLLKSPQERLCMGEAGKKLLHAQADSMKRTLEAILPFLNRSP